MVVRTLRRWNRLGAKVAAAITLVSVVTLGAFLGVVLDTQRRHLVGQEVRSGAMLSDTIISSITNDMMHDRRDEAYRVMDTIVRDEQVHQLRVLDGHGSIRYSTRATDVGQTANLHDETCALGEEALHDSASQSGRTARDQHRLSFERFHSGGSCSRLGAH